MKKIYKGHEIEVKRERCLGGWDMLYYTIYRLSDGFGCVCDLENSSETVRDKIKHLCELIDEELKSKDPWGEAEGDGA